MSAIYSDMIEGAAFIDRATMRRVEAAVRRDWAVRVLDAWCRENKRRQWEMLDGSGQMFGCVIHDAVWSGGRIKNGGRQYPAITAEGARLAAAEAVWPELPESVRAEIGERP